MHKKSDRKKHIQLRTLAPAELAAVEGGDDKRYTCPGSCDKLTVIAAYPVPPSKLTVIIR